MNDFNPKTVTIGNHVWMAENLAIDDGGEGITYNDDNGEYYYTWEAAMRVAKSIQGWHLPTALEWNEAALACGATEMPYPHRNDYDDVQELKSKLGVKLVGSYGGSFPCMGHGTTLFWTMASSTSGIFSSVGMDAFFWTSTEFSSSDAYRQCFSTGISMDSNLSFRFKGYSVRLVKDN